MFSSRLSRFIALSGAAGWLILVVLNDLAGGSSPKYDASPGEWATYVAGHRGAAAQAGLYGELVGLALAMVFVAVLYTLLRRAEGDRGIFATIALTGGIVAAATKMASAAPLMAATYLSDKGLDGEMIRVLANINGAGFALAFIPNGVMMVAIGAGVLSYRFLPAWLGWSALAAGVALIAGAPFVQDDGPGFIGMLLFLLWNVVASVTLFVKWPSLTAAEGEAPPPTKESRAAAALA